MRIPPYWAKGTYARMDRKGNDRAYWAWGWSFASRAAAEQDAAERAKRIFDCLTGGARPDSYDYFDRPFREEIIDTIRQGEDQIALITRNKYGALILNSASVCFADVDFPQVKSQGLLDSLSLLFSPGKKKQRLAEACQVQVQKVRDWAQQNPGHSFRLYRTRAGLRLLFTDRLYDPTSNDTVDLLTSLGSDALYRRLTEKQECFRARLTPKPWRCGLSTPQHRYPWEDPDQEKTCRQWERDYEKDTAGYATCQLLDTFGAAEMDDQVRAIVDIHDKHACGDEGAKLA